MTAPPTVGARWGERFDVLEAKDGGPGRMTYLARDRAFGTDVELWWIVPGVHRDQAAEALMHGAATLRSLVHPAVRTLVDAGFAEGTTWAAYEVAAPGVLPRERSPLPTPAVAAWARAVAAGLLAAHQVGWCHGRLVPADVVKLQGSLRVGGLALWMMAEPVSIAAWQAQAPYLAPEVVAGWAPSAASDVWGVAAAVAALTVGTPRAIEERGLLEARSGPLAAALASALVPDPGARIGLVELVRRIDEVAASAGPEAFAPTPSRAVPLSSLPLHLLRPTAGVSSAPAAGAWPPAAPAFVPAAAAPAFAPPPAAPPMQPGQPAAAAPSVAPPTPVPPGSMPRHRTTPPPIPAGARRATGPQRKVTPPMMAAVEAPAPRGPAGDAFSISQVTGAVERAKMMPGQAISMRPGGARRPTGPMEAAKGKPEPDHPKAVLRPLSELSSATVEAGAIGWMAPPRELAPRPRRRWIPIVGVLFGAAAAATIAIVVATQTGVDDSGGDSAGSAASGDPGGPGAVAGSAAGPAAPRFALSPVEPARGCTDEHLALGDVCIDPFEAPGRGRVPATSLTARDAADACAARGLRLCTPDEWRHACAGTEAVAGEAGACNLGHDMAIVAGGSFERCVSAIEAHDLIGNVAEWVADGTALGASAMDGADGRCDGPPRAPAADATLVDVGYRCCGDR